MICFVLLTVRGIIGGVGCQEHTLCYMYWNRQSISILHVILDYRVYQHTSFEFQTNFCHFRSKGIIFAAFLFRDRVLLILNLNDKIKGVTKIYLNYKLFLNLAMRYFLFYCFAMH